MSNCGTLVVKSWWTFTTTLVVKSLGEHLLRLCYVKLWYIGCKVSVKFYYHIGCKVLVHIYYQYAVVKLWCISCKNSVNIYYVIVKLFLSFMHIFMIKIMYYDERMYLFEFEIIAPNKPFFLTKKCWYFSYFSKKKHVLWYSLKAAYWGTSAEYS